MGKLNEQELQELREFFSGDKFAEMTGCHIEEAGDDYSICTMKVTDMHRNAFGGIMGGAMVTLADYAAAVVSNRPGKYTTANSMNTTFVGNSKDSLMIAEAKLLRDGRSTNYVEIKIKDSTGKPLAFVTSLGFHLSS